MMPDYPSYYVFGVSWRLGWQVGFSGLFCLLTRERLRAELFFMANFDFPGCKAHCGVEDKKGAVQKDAWRKSAEQNSSK